MRKMGWILVAVVLALASNASAQVDTAWTRRFVGNGGGLDSPVDLAVLSHNSVAVTGYCGFDAIDRKDLVTILYDSSGNLLWTGWYSGLYGRGAFPSRIAATPDGGVVVVGREWVSLFYGTGHTIIKYAADGRSQWIRRDSTEVGGTFEDVCVDSFGNIFVVGTINGGGVRKYSPDGEMMFRSLPDKGFLHVRLDMAGNILAVGRGIFESYPNGGYRQGVSAAKISPSGAVLWTSEFPWSRGYTGDIRDVEVDLDGSLIIAGAIANRHEDGVVFTGDDLAIAKLDPNGAVAWEHIHDMSLETGWIDDWISDIELAPDRSFYSIGSQAIKFDLDGRVIWSRNLPNSEIRTIVIDRHSNAFCPLYQGLGVAIRRYNPDGSIIDSPVFHIGTICTPVTIGFGLAGTMFFAGASRIIGDRESFDYAVAALNVYPCLQVDILPGACPNVVGTVPGDLGYSRISAEPAGVSKPTVPIAILGTKSFDVSRVDPSTIQIAGLSPTGHRLIDVSRPVEPESECECTTAGADGFVDLVLYFDREQFIAALAPITDGEVRTLALSGKTKTGVPLSGSDCVTIKEGPIRISPMASSGERVEAGFAAYPNPFNAATVISFLLATDSDVRLDVYDVLGRHVATLVDEHMPAGEYNVSWDAAGWASGMYFARLATSDGMMTRKMVLVR